MFVDKRSEHGWAFQMSEQLDFVVSEDSGRGAPWVPVAERLPDAAVLFQPRPLRAVGLFPDVSVLTAEGPVPAGRLAPGQALVTASGGRATLRAVLSTPSDPDAAPPVLIRAGALGPLGPGRDLCLAAGHRIGLYHPEALFRYGSEVVLVEAQDLAHLPGVQRLVPRQRALLHLVLDSYEAIAAAGVLIESFALGDRRIASLPVEAASALFEACPRLRYAGAAASFLPRQVVLDRREAYELFQPLPLI